MKSIEASSTCVGRITDGRVSKAIYTLLSFSIQDKEKGSSNAVMQQLLRSALGATASHAYKG